MSHRIVFAPDARDDLLALYDFIAERAGASRALAYIERIEICCRSLTCFPVRGTARDDVRPGLRTLGFERRATIAFSVAAETVTILRILYGGRDLTGVFSDEKGKSC